MKVKNLSRFLTITLTSFLLSSCANMQAMVESQAEERKEISVQQKLQLSIPLPENSKYLLSKTVIFGEGNNFTCLLYTSDAADE